MSCCKRTRKYKEGYDHCRWKTAFKKFVKNIKERDYIDFAFKDLFISLLKKSKKFYGVGLLSVYDVSADISRRLNIKIGKVFIIGDGPKRAVKLLNIKLRKIHYGKILLRYTTKKDIITAFKKSRYNIDKNMLKNRDCDDFESYLCNWQKNIL